MIIEQLRTKYVIRSAGVGGCMCSKLLHMQVAIPMGRWLMEVSVPFDPFQMVGYIPLRGVSLPHTDPTDSH